MAEQHVALMKGLGIPDEKIQAIEAMSGDAAKGYKPDEDIAIVRTGISSSLLNDNDFLSKIPAEKVPETVKKEVEKGQYGRFMNEIEAVAKAMNIDYSDATDAEKKSIKGFTTKILTKHGLTIGKGAEGLKELQDQLLLANNTIKTTTEAKAGEIEAAVNAVKGKLGSKVQKMLVLSEITGLTDLELSVVPTYIIEKVMQDLNAVATPVWNEENDSIQLMQKGNKELRLMNADKTKEVTLKDWLKEKLVADGVAKVKKKDGGGGGGGRKTTTVDLGGDGGDDDAIGSDILDKINKNMKPAT